MYGGRILLLNAHLCRCDVGRATIIYSRSPDMDGACSQVNCPILCMPIANHHPMV